VLCVGGTLAVLAERLYLFDLLGGGLEDSRCVNGGLIIAEHIGKLYVIGRKLAFESTLTNGQIGKVFEIISDERVDSCSTIRVTSRLTAGLLDKSSSANIDELHLLTSTTTTSASAMTTTSTGAAGTTSTERRRKNSKDIFLDDDITSATTDLYGKKLFIGTHSGKILLLDTTTIGILNHLTYHEQEMKSREILLQGPVVMMKYCQQNELLVVVHTSGVLKIFCGCHRTITIEQREKYLSKKMTTTMTSEMKATSQEWCPYSLGGNTPSSPTLLRSNQMTHETTVLTMAVSEELGLIAVSGVDGTGFTTPTTPPVPFTSSLTFSFTSPSV
jgi:hypothetical protein